MATLDVSGKVVVVGGKLSSLRKKDAQARLEALGATVRTSASGATDILFLGEGGERDRTKAEKKGVPIYDEAALKSVLTIPVEVEGKTVVLAGQFKVVKKADATAFLKEMGAVVRGSVSKATDLLFSGLNGGANKAKARKLELPIFDEEDLLVTIAPLRSASSAETGSDTTEVAAEASATTEEAAAASSAAYNFEGKVIVLTGKFSEFKRSEAESILSRAGATISRSVSGKTDLLIYGARAGSKLRNARGFGTAMMTEAEFMEILPTLTLAEADPEPEEEEEPVATQSDPASEFAGLKIVLTGTFATMKRGDAKKLLVAAGASVSGSVSKKTDLLIHGSNAGSKLSKAMTLGTRILTEADFIDILNSSAVESELLDGAAEKVAEKAAKEEKRMRAVRKIINSIHDPQKEKWGITLGHLLLKYIHVFSQRPDVFVFDYKPSGPVDNSNLEYFSRSLPPEWLAQLSEFNSLEFNWVFNDDRKKERSNYSKGYNGGRINLRGVNSSYILWWDIPDWRKEYENFKQEATFDDFVAEGMTMYSYNPGQTSKNASLIFDNANDCERHPLGSLEDYITEGAKAAFTWYWQMSDWEGNNFSNELYGNSIPSTTPRATVLELLKAKGCNDEEALGLCKWLGDNVNVLLHASETPEGKERIKLTKVFPALNESSERDMDHGMIANLTEAADPLTQEEWDDMLKAHQLFLQSGGAGGSWTPLSVSGLPLCMYQGGAATDGEQAVFRLKRIEGIDASGVNLSTCDMSGARAENINFSGTNLSHSMIIDSIMDGCNFDGANLEGIDFSGTSLKGASFVGANLEGADMEATDLTGADLTGANLEGSRFPGAIVTDVKY